MKDDTATPLTSGIYLGQVRHRRFSPRRHAFSYGLYMLVLDLDELPHFCKNSIWFGTKWWSFLRFKQSDYLQITAEQPSPNLVKSDPPTLKQRITDKAQELGEHRAINRIVMVAQGRCFGLYFSPVNFYFLMDGDTYLSMIAEVSNTPWNQTHYYLVPMQDGENRKDFHVSPFMALDMVYKWRIKPPSASLLVHIENHQDDKVFDATLALHRQPITNKNLRRLLLRHPFMTLKIVVGIYWQALRLFAKKIPFVAHPNT